MGYQLCFVLVICFASICMEFYAMYNDYGVPIPANVETYRLVEKHVPLCRMDGNGNYETGPPRIERQWEKMDSFCTEDYQTFIMDKQILRESFSEIQVRYGGLTYVLDLSVHHRNVYRYRRYSFLFYEAIIKNIVANAACFCIFPLLWLSPTIGSCIIQMVDGVTLLVFFFIRIIAGMIFGINEEGF